MGQSYLEVWRPAGAEVVLLEEDQITIGRAGANAVSFPYDGSVSRLHAVMERFPTGWCIRDIGSSNGTYVNGKKVLTERNLQPGDEISVGGSRMIFRAPSGEILTATAVGEEPPDLTKREKEVLVALCRPMLSGGAFTQPLSVKALAEQFVVSEAAIKFHLASLYDKFGLYETGDGRRVRLANEAVRRRAVTMSDLRSSAE